ncbi:hypothetical protein [Neopusillimonas aromaticivorans]|uniref:hypothetical protein n=1 Tax=Neopusillimonas aromaticivorans TaxID=2979868 RepID=UPI002598B537|nr:hypothetical protein [Neopusillimonas aromaticivorans]WJJ94746.1 hypothetical protein N7E01_07550 [Neopusillimonas aromaticivorans]
MKVVLSVDPIKFPLTGIGRYTFELAQGLQRAGLQDLQFLRGVGLTRQIPVPNQAQPMSTLPAWKQLAQKNRWVVAAFRTINPWLKARALRGLEDHVFHGPNYYLPPFGGRSVVTMHDLSPYLWSQSHPRAGAVYASRDRAFPETCKRPDYRHGIYASRSSAFFRGR